MNSAPLANGKMFEYPIFKSSRTETFFEREKFWYGLLGLLLLLFIVVKLPFLPLPYFWDEAWPYGTAIRIMHENGISLKPGAIPPDISRGHPLLFHALVATWMKVFGTSLTSGHIFSMLISLLLLFFTFLFGKYFFSGIVGSIAAILLMVQPVFLAQSGLMLPEILVALLMLLSLFAFIRKQYFLYVIIASMLCLTKESGVVIFPVLFIAVLTDKFVLKNITLRSIVFKFCIILIPLMISAIFFIYQKNVFGWYFFPEHTSGISIQPAILFQKLENYFSYLFLFQRRNMISVLIILTSIVFYKKSAGLYAHNRIVIFLAILIVVYLLFSSMCFYSPRYILACIPPLTIIASYYLVEIAGKNRLLFACVPIVLFLQISYSFKHQSNDHHLSYAHCVKVNQLVVDYCEKGNFYDKKIFTHFLMRESLSNHFAGYLSGQPFLHVLPEFSDDIDYCIFSDYEYTSEFDHIKKNRPLKLIKRFELKKTWTEIYEAVKP